MDLIHTTPIDRSTEGDEAGLIQAAQRDPAAFAPLYDRYVHGLYRYVRSKIGVKAEAEDVTSQTFLSALESLPRYRHHGHFGAWLFTIARRKVTDHYRQPASVDPPGEAIDVRPGSFDQVVRRQEHDRLRRLIGSLSEDGQELIRLRYTAELPFAQIAVILGRPEDTVKKTLYRALARLRAEWEGNDA